MSALLRLLPQHATAKTKTPAAPAENPQKSLGDIEGRHPQEAPRLSHAAVLDFPSPPSLMQPSVASTSQQTHTVTFI